MKDALRRMYTSTPDHPEGENIFYYLTIYNEPYPQPAELASYPGGSDALERAILRGLYEYSPSQLDGDHPQAQILASGVAVRAALQAQQLLADDWGGSAGGGAAGPVRDPGGGRPAGPGRRGQRLDPGRPGPDRPLGAGGLHLAPHRRLRFLRHPGRGPPLLA